MDRLEKSKASFIFFIIIIIVLLIGGSYLISNINKEPEKKTDKSIKIVEDKDYIYNESNECLSVLIPICYPKIKININSEDAKNLEKTLNDNMDNLDREYTKISETDTTDEELLYYYDDIYSAKVINYVNHVSAYVLSLAVTSYDYYATADYQNEKLEVYNFDLKTGNLLENEEVLKLYNLSMDDVIKKINKEEITKLDSYTIMVDDNNNLVIDYVAHNGDINYNNSITIYR